jgi:hypothetical protein
VRVPPVVALCGLAQLAACDALLGLPATTYVGGPDAGDVADGVASDSCAPGCQTFTSCKQLAQQFPAAPSGVYMLDAGTGVFQAYCELSADGGGWTLAMKVDGRMQTFAYDQPLWTDSSLFGASSANLDGTEAKLETFNAIPFTELRIGIEFPIGSGTRNWLVLPISGSRLRDVFAGAPATTSLGRDTWKGLLGAAASLQPACNAEGINIGNTYARVRIGIIGNNEDDCLTPDSRLGIGGSDQQQCPFPTPGTVGNSACYSPDNGEVEHVAFGYVLVR